MLIFSGFFSQACEKLQKVIEHKVAKVLTTGIKYKAECHYENESQLRKSFLETAKESSAEIHWAMGHVDHNGGSIVWQYAYDQVFHLIY